MKLSWDTGADTAIEERIGGQGTYGDTRNGLMGTGGVVAWLCAEDACAWGSSYRGQPSVFEWDELHS